MKKVAVLLCGSGFKDGSEIRESVGALWALSHYKDVAVQCFAPDEPQTEVVNCLTLETDRQSSRNMLVESARIARAQVKPLTELHSTEFDGLVIPGGFGVAKNLCDFAFKGAKGTAHPLAARVIQAFHQQKKPIAAICIAPALVALALKPTSIEVTLGPESETSNEVKKLGAITVAKSAFEYHADLKHKILSTPAYLYDSAALSDMFQGIQSMVRHFYEWL